MVASAALRPAPFPAFATVADLLHYLGDIPAERVRLRPTPGTATENDVLHVEAHEDCLCELIAGTLVEKPTGFLESRLAIILGAMLFQFVDQHDLGVIAGESGMVRLEFGRIRIPDLCFVSWDRLPSGELPTDAILRIAPDLAVEILSESNTRKEMEQKLLEYFEAGVRLVWYIDPVARTVQVYTSPRRSRILREADTLDGGKVLPGFSVGLKGLFAAAHRRKRRK